MSGRKSKYACNQNENPKKKIWYVAEYIRLSQEDSNTGSEKAESNSITSQKNLLNEFIKEHENFVLYDTYVDDGYTGTDFNRPGFKKLLDDIKNGSVNCVVVKDLSRLGRNYIEVGNYIEQVFPIFNIRFIAINDNIDSVENPMSSNTILVPFKNLINDEYARDTSIKIRSALNARMKKGEFVGAFPSYGYIKDKNDRHKLIIDEEAAGIVRKIFEWKVYDGMGNLAICHRLNEMGILNPTGYKKKQLKQNYNNSKIIQEDYSWCPSTVRNILKNDVYIGNVTQGKRKVKSYKVHKVEQVPEEDWVTVENMHESILDLDLFEKAQELRNIDTRAQKCGSVSIWAGILKCADCGRMMQKKCCKNKNGKVYEYYVCGSYSKKSKKLCTKHTIKVDKLEEYVEKTVNKLIEHFIDKKNIIDKLNRFKPDNQDFHRLEKIRNTKNHEYENLINIKRSLYEDWKNGYLTRIEYLDYKKMYEAKIKKIEKDMKNIDEEKVYNEKLSNFSNQYIQNFTNNGNLRIIDREVLIELLDYIEIYEKNKIKIHFKFSI